LPDNFFKLFRDPRLMPHMHLPIQSGSDSVLRRMARRCKTDEFARLVDKAREAIPLFNVTTDLITGFPGESEQEWRQTVNFVSRTGFGHVHIFPFSARAGTKAARLPEQLDGAIKKARSREMHALAAELKRTELARHPGTNPEIDAASITEVSIDGVSADGSMLVNNVNRPQVAVAEIGQFSARG
jgi:threonylcarbamoyladenosine tRNA methylthiotransferase MtaB